MASGRRIKRFSCETHCHVRRYVSIFGPLAISRSVYGTRERQKHERIPLDALMQMVGLSILCVLDIFHVLERLWVAAQCFHPEGSEEAKAFVAERLRRVLEGDVGYVIGDLKQMGTKHPLKGSTRQHLAKVITYLENNRSYLRYDMCLAPGYPIGSGVVEGTCRHVVKDRMEGTGMHWCIAGAQSMLHLRAIHLNGDWDTFQCYRIETASRQLYPYPSFVRSLYRKTGRRAASYAHFNPQELAVLDCKGTRLEVLPIQRCDVTNRTVDADVPARSFGGFFGS